MSEVRTNWGRTRRYPDWPSAPVVAPIDSRRSRGRKPAALRLLGRVRRLG